MYHCAHPVYHHSFFAINCLFLASARTRALNVSILSCRVNLSGKLHSNLTVKIWDSVRSYSPFISTKEMDERRCTVCLCFRIFVIWMDGWMDWLTGYMLVPLFYAVLHSIWITRRHTHTRSLKYTCSSAKMIKEKDWFKESIVTMLTLAHEIHIQRARKHTHTYKTLPLLS